MTPRQVLKNWIIAFNNADVESIAQLYHDDSTNDHAANESVIGKDAILEMFASEFAVAKMVRIAENIFARAGNWERKDLKGLRGSGFFHTVNDKILFQCCYRGKLALQRLHRLADEETK